MQSNIGNYGPFDGKYFVQEDPLSSMLDMDKKDLVARIAKLDEWLSNRKRVLEDNLARIEDDICSVDTEIYRMKAISPYDTRPIVSLEGTLMALDMQKRLEQSGAWKDMWLVGKEQLELLRQYQQLIRRRRILA